MKRPVVLLVTARPGLKALLRGASTMFAQPDARGRKRTATLEDVRTALERAGGKLEGSMGVIGAKLGLSKSSAHRALHAMAGAGMISLATSAAGTLVQMRPPT